MPYGAGEKMKRSAKKALALAVGGICIQGLAQQSAWAAGPTVESWDTSASNHASYNTASNWFGGVVPVNNGGNTYEALFSVDPTQNNYTVTFASNNTTVDSLIDTVNLNPSNATSPVENLDMAAASGGVTLALVGQNYSPIEGGGTLSNVILANDPGNTTTTYFTLSSNIAVPLQNASNTIYTSAGTGAIVGPTVEIDGPVTDGGQSSSINFYGGGNSNADGGNLILTNTSNTFSGGMTIGNAGGTEGGSLEMLPDSATTNGTGGLIAVTGQTTGTGSILVNEQGQILLEDNTTTAGTLYFMNSGETLTIEGIGVNKNVSGNIRTNFGNGIKVSASGAGVTDDILANIIIGTSLPSEGYNDYVIISATKQKNITIEWSGVVSGGPGAVGIDKQGSGNLEFSNPSNTFGGAMQIGNGEVEVAPGSSMGTGDLIMAQTSSNFTEVNLYNTTQNIGSLSSTFLQGMVQNAENITAYFQQVNLFGPVASSTAGTNLILHQNEDTAFGYTSQAGFCSLTSIISDGLGIAGSGSNGQGTLTLAAGSTGILTLNGSNTYNGGTYINGGTLNVANGSGFLVNLPTGGQTNQFAPFAGSATGFGDVFVNAGGTLISGNNAQVLGVTMTSGSIGEWQANANLWVGAGGVVNPGGVNQAGTLYVNGNVNAAGGSIFDMDILGGTSATNDQVVIYGDLNTSGTATLNISGSSLAFGNYTLFQSQSLTNGTADFALGTTPSPLSPSIQRSYSIVEDGQNVVLQIIDTGTDRFWSVGGSSPAQDGSGNWSSGSTNFFSQSGTVSTTQSAYSNASNSDLIIGGGGNGGTITLTGNVNVGGPLVFSPVSGAYTISGSDSLTLDSGLVSSNNATISAPVLMGNSVGTQTFSAATGTTLNFSGGIGETGGLHQVLTTSGLGTIVLGGVGGYTGGTDVSQGNLQVTTQSLPAAGGVSVAGGANLIFSQGTVGSYSGIIGGAGNVVIDNTSGGAVTLSCTSNAYTGTTVLEGGVLAVGSVNELGTGDGGIELAGGTLQATANNISFPLSTPNTITTTITLESNTTSVVDTNGNNLTFGQQLAGAGNLTKVGQGTVTFTALHSTNEIGSLAISAGAVVFDEPGNPSFGFSGSIGSSNTFVGDLDIDTPTDVRIFAGNVSGGGNINVAGAATGSIIEGRDVNGNYVTTIGNPINLNGGAAIEVLANSSLDVLQLAAPITGNGSVDFTGGSGQEVLSASNTYTGTTTIDEGLGDQGDVQLGIDNALPTGTDLSVTSSGQFDLNGHNQSVNSLAGSTNAVILNEGTVGSILTITGSDTTTFKGFLEDGEQSSLGLTLATQSTGQLNLTSPNILDGAGTGLSGPITINGGRLDIETTGALGAPSVVTVGAQVGNSQLRFDGVNGTITYSSVSTPDSPASPIVLTGMGGYNAAGTLDMGAISVGSTSNVILPSPITLQVSSDIQVGTNSTLTLLGSISGTGALFTSGSGTLTLAGTNSWTGGTTIGSGSYVVANTALPSSLPINNQGTLQVNASGTVGTITGSGVLSVGTATLQLANGSGLSTVSAVAVATGGKLDITNNAIAVNFGSPANDPVAAITTFLSTGYNGGTWNGTGIISSVAAGGPLTPLLSVGYADGNIDSGTPAAANQILIMYTLAGDAKLQGTVNFADLLVVAQNFNKSGEDWAGGNFIYSQNGLVNFSDLLIVAQNFNKVLNPAGSGAEAIGGTTLPLVGQVPVATDSVPEPGAFALAMAGAGILARRRRRSVR
jgi:fibronectin-binding autotransporter adhesin